MPSKSPKKLRKPYPTFPLGAHPTGYWCKRIRGRLHYFGARWADPNDALDEYLAQAEDLHAGREPRRHRLSLADGCNLFLASCDSRVQAGELADASFQKYRRTAIRICDVFGPNKPIEELRPTDFARLRSELAASFRSPSTIASEVVRTKAVFKWLHESEEIENPVRFGPDFKQPNLPHPSAREEGRAQTRVHAGRDP